MSTVSIDFSNTTKLTKVVLRSEEHSILWIIKALKTITSKHRDLLEVAIHINFYNVLIFLSNPINARQTVGDQTYALWMDLDRLLIQLSELGAARVRVGCWSKGEDEWMREYVEGLLPEAANGGGTKLLYYNDL